jgi:hypothetical protein
VQKVIQIYKRILKLLKTLKTFAPFILKKKKLVFLCPLQEKELKIKAYMNFIKRG